MGNGKTIYLADDDADDRFLLIEAIVSIDSEIEIVETENGQELLAILLSKRVSERSLIILDMNMPIINGLETLANLHSVPELASLPAIMPSTSDNSQMIKFAKQLGAIEFYQKPSSMTDLLDLSRRIIFDGFGTC